MATLHMIYQNSIKFGLHFKQDPHKFYTSVGRKVASFSRSTYPWMGIDYVLEWRYTLSWDIDRPCPGIEIYPSLGWRYPCAGMKLNPVLGWRYPLSWYGDEPCPGLEIDPVLGIWTLSWDGYRP